MAEMPTSPNLKHIVKVVHAGAKFLTSNFDFFHPPPPSNQGSRYQPLADAKISNAEFISSKPVQPRRKHKDKGRVLKDGQLEQHMAVCLTWEGQTTLEVTTYQKPAGTSTYLKINRITQWKDGHQTPSTMYEPLLEDFESAANEEQWKADVLRVVYREDDGAWWHVQKRMRRDGLRDPYKMSWKARERVDNVAQPSSTQRKRKLPWQTASAELGKVFKRNPPLSTREQVQKGQVSARKGKRKLPWTSDTPAPRKRKTASSKAVVKAPSKPRQGTLSEWFRSRGEVDPDDDEEALDAIMVKVEENRARVTTENMEDTASGEEGMRRRRDQAMNDLLRSMD